MERYDQNIRVTMSLSATLKFGVERILSNAFCKKKCNAENSPVYLIHESGVNQCYCPGNCQKSINRSTFIPTSQIFPSRPLDGLSMMHKFRNLYRPTPVRPAIAGKYF